MNETTHKGKITGHISVSSSGVPYGSFRKAPGVDLPTKEEEWETMSGPVRRGTVNAKGDIDYDVN